MNLTLGDRVRKARKIAKLTQKELAKKAKMKSQGALSDLENGRNKSSSYLYDIAKITGVDYDWLLTGKGEINPNIHRPIDDIPISEMQPPINNNEPEIKIAMDALKKFLNSDEGFLIEKFRNLSTTNKQAVINIVSGIDNTDADTNNKTVNNSVINSPHSHNNFNN